MRIFPSLLLAGVCWAIFPSLAADQVVHIYNWSDYIGAKTLEKFEQATGIKPIYDVYDSNEVLEAKLLAGNSGYDLVFPTARPFAQRHLTAGLYRKLDKDQLKNLGNLDPGILQSLQDVDPGNAYLVPYMWGTTGIGYNVTKLQEILGDSVPRDSWRLIFDPEVAAKLTGCGISMLDDEVEGLSATLIYLGKDPNTTDPAEIAAAADAFAKVRPYIRYFHSSQYINDLANGDLCVAQGYSGDVLQARDRAQEAGNNVQVALAIPREGAVLAVDVMAIPADAPHPENALAFIDFILRPEVVAEISSEVSFANANAAATPLMDESIRNDPGIYPPAEVKAKLVAAKVMPPPAQRLRVRTWTRIKSGK